MRAQKAGLCFATFALAVAMSGCADKDGGTDDAGASGETGGEVDFDPVPARGGITIRRVEFNPSIGVDIALDGEWVGGAGRQGQIPNYREAMVRILWGDLPADWQARELIARFTIETPSGERLEFDNYGGPVLVDRDSDEAKFDRQFFVQIPPEAVIPGSKFQASLWEGAPGYEDIPEGAPAVSPTSGYELIGIESAPVETKVMMVPVQYTWNECSTDTALLTEEEKQGFVDLLRKSNPVQTAEIVWRETGIVRTTQIGDPPDLWGALQQIKAEDNPDPNVFYYALYDACSGPFGTLGTAPTANIPPTKDAATARFASGKWHQGNPVSGYETFVHEIGHVQSNPHAPCGGAAGTDPGYPHDEADIGVWGFDIEPQKPGLYIYAPTTGKDYMSYCSPSWVSDYRWRKLHDHMRVLTSWDYESSTPQPGAETAAKLTGVVYADGTQRWWLVDGLVADDIGEAVAPLTSGTGATQLKWPTVRSDIQDMEGSSFVQVQLGSDDEAAHLLERGLRVQLDGWTYEAAPEQIEDLRAETQLHVP